MIHLIQMNKPTHILLKKYLRLQSCHQFLPFLVPGSVHCSSFLHSFKPHLDNVDKISVISSLHLFWLWNRGRGVRVEGRRPWALFGIYCRKISRIHSVHYIHVDMQTFYPTIDIMILHCGKEKCHFHLFEVRFMPDC